MKKNYGILSFSVGFFTGLLAGLLFAPNSSDYTINQLKMAYEDCSEEAVRKSRKVKNYASSLYGYVADAYRVYSPNSDILPLEGRTYSKEFK